MRTIALHMVCSLDPSGTSPIRWFRCEGFAVCSKRVKYWPSNKKKTVNSTRRKSLRINKPSLSPSRKSQSFWREFAALAALCGCAMDTSTQRLKTT